MDRSHECPLIDPQPSNGQIWLEGNPPLGTLNLVRRAQIGGLAGGETRETPPSPVSV